VTLASNCEIHLVSRIEFVASGDQLLRRTTDEKSGVTESVSTDRAYQWERVTIGLSGLEMTQVLANRLPDPWSSPITRQYPIQQI
jgi:hypothetical protein